MPERPFHHGGLRDELLERAETVLRDRGVDALSLRELARDAGVSHGAPRNHFADRGALLDAMAERGFRRLAREIEEAAAGAPDHEAAMRAAGRTYIGFAVRDRGLIDLMFAAKATSPSASTHDAVDAFYRTMSALLVPAVESGAIRPEAAARIGPVLLMAIQGVASSIASGWMPVADGERVIDDAIGLALGALPIRASERR